MTDAAMIPAFDTHLCLVSEQAVPNLAPALDPRLRPRRVVLVASNKDMAERAGWLAAVLKRHGVESVIHPLARADDPGAMRGEFDALHARYPHLALNVTGGKKTMALAAYAASLGHGRPVFYVERDNHLHWLEGARLPPEPLAPVLGLADLLNAYGHDITQAQADPGPENVRAFARELFPAARRYAVPLVGLQPLGQDEDKKLVSKLSHAGGDSTPALELAERHGLARRSGKDWLCNAHQASVITGGWLEYHVHALVQALADGGLPIRDIRRSLKFYNRRSGEPNEIDVAFVCANRLYLIECKARKPGAKQSGTDFLYTLESVRKAGGLAAEALLLVWGGKAGDSLQARARDLRIRLLNGPDLAQAEAALKTWITQ